MIQNPSLSLSVLVPAYNEERTLAQVVAEVNETLSHLIQRYEVVIIDDGSRDTTGKIAECLCKENNRIRVIHHAQNLGFGAVQRAGFLSAKYDYVILIPADGQFDIRELPRILESIENNDILVGAKRDYYKRPFQLRVIKSRCYNLALRVFFGLRFYDTQWIKVIRRSFLEKSTLKSKSAFIDAEILITAIQMRCKIKEIMVSYFPRRVGVSKGSNISVAVMTMIEMLGYWVRFKINKLKKSSSA